MFSVLLIIVSMSLTAPALADAAKKTEVALQST